MNEKNIKKGNILKDNDIDVDASIEILGDLEMYNETLKDFYDLSEEKLEKIENAKNNNDLNSYSIEVHALKSDAKYLGLKKLADMALEHQLKSQAGDEEYVNMHYDELIEELKKDIDIISKYLNI